MKLNTICCSDDACTRDDIIFRLFLRWVVLSFSSCCVWLYVTLKSTTAIITKCCVCVFPILFFFFMIIICLKVVAPCLFVFPISACVLEFDEEWLQICLSSRHFYSHGDVFARFQAHCAKFDAWAEKIEVELHFKIRQNRNSQSTIKCVRK